jgi:hypothetical protein
MNRVHLVLFDVNNRIFGPYSASSCSLVLLPPFLPAQQGPLRHHITGVARELSRSGGQGGYDDPFPSLVHFLDMSLPCMNCVAFYRIRAAWDYDVDSVRARIWYRHY